MLSRTLLGMRWGDLSEDTRQMLLDRADIDGFNGADGDRYSRGTLHFRNTLMGIQASVETDRFPVIWETTAFSLMMMLSFPASNNHLNKNTLHKPIMIKAAMMMTLITRVLVKIFGLFCIFLGGTGGGTSCLVPQIGHMRTPSRSSVPHLGQIISSTPVLLLCIL